VFVSKASDLGRGERGNRKRKERRPCDSADRGASKQGKVPRSNHTTKGGKDNRGRGQYREGQCGTIVGQDLKEKLSPRYADDKDRKTGRYPCQAIRQKKAAASYAGVKRIRKK